MATHQHDCDLCQKVPILTKVTVLLACILRMLWIPPASGAEALTLVQSTTRPRCAAQPEGQGLGADLTDEPT